MTKTRFDMLNGERAERAAQAIALYTDEEAETNLIDLLADLHHWAERELFGKPCHYTDVDDKLADVLRIASDHYDAEKMDQD